MNIKSIIVLGLSIFSFSIKAQDLGNDYRIIHIHKKVSELSYENPCESPLSNYLARIHVLIEEKYDTVYSERIAASVKSNLKPISSKYKEQLLNATIEDAVIYKDSIGFVFSKQTGYEGDLIVGMSQWENGKWLGTGEGICGGNTPDAINKYIEERALSNLFLLRKYYQLSLLSTDTLAFVNYLKQTGQDPKTYLLSKLTDYPLVIFGETHFRTISWNLMRKLVKTPDFERYAGKIFLELSVSAQPLLDRFFNNPTREDNLILDIFRSEEMFGWNNRGMYEFLLDVWEVNKRLPGEKKIRVFAVDFPRPYYTLIETNEQYDNFYKNTPDRNVCMANTIENQIQTHPDARSSLFIVGSGHAYKSAALLKGGFQPVGLSAGYLLTKKFSNKSVFSTFLHYPLQDNRGYLYGKIRKGLFDYAFAQNDNTPVAFDLYNSPFGSELFDGQEIAYQNETGTFANNYDGYIFLQPLHKELTEKPLYELYTKKFMTEIKRRAHIAGEDEKYEYDGKKLKDIDRQDYIRFLQAREGKRKYPDIEKF